jgi:hypothetical protein
MAVTLPGAQAKPPPLKPFALGTSLYPVPIAGPGRLVYSPGGSALLTPIPKSGFLAVLRYTMRGVWNLATPSTDSGQNAQLTDPLGLIKNYNLANSLAYPYRSLSAHDIAQVQAVTSVQGLQGPTTQSLTYSPGGFFSTGTNNTDPQEFQVVWEDLIGHNGNLNFARYVLSAMTTSNDLTITFQFVDTTALAKLFTLPAGATLGSVQATISVSAEYLTVPDPTVYAWPNRKLVQQWLGDASYNTPQQGLNTINLTPIQGPEFLGLGIEVVDRGANVSYDLNSPVSGVDIYVNGTIPLMQFTLADLVMRYERMFGRRPDRYLWLDFSNDLGLVNAMSHLHRKVLSTSKYSQISVNVTLNDNFTGGAGSYINLLKRTQQSYGGNL